MTPRERGSATFGEKVRELRQQRGITQMELIERLAHAGYRVGQSYISQIEHGNKTPPYHGIVAIAQVFDADLGMLLEIGGYPRPVGLVSHLATDIFFRSHDEPEPSAFDTRLLHIEHLAGPRYLLYPVASAVSCPYEQIRRQGASEMTSEALWRERRQLFEQQLLCHPTRIA